MKSRPPHWHEIVAGVAAGTLGALAYSFALHLHGLLTVFGSFIGMTSPNGGLLLVLLLGTIGGVGFGLLLRRKIQSPGAGLFWGTTYGLLLWIVGPLTLLPMLYGYQPDWTVGVARAGFTYFFANIIAYGSVIGLTYPVILQILTRHERPDAVRQLSLSLLQSLVIGGLAGLIGGIAFGAWMAHENVYPLIAGLVRSTSPGTGQMVHLMISVIIGATYGILFRCEIVSAGSSVIRGTAYGMLWWLLGPLTIMPLWLGYPIRWTVAAARDAFPSLVGHIVYGILLGLVFAIVDRMWRILFTESDPLRRRHEGPGMRGLRTVVRGVLASIAGGLVFTIVMIRTDSLPTVAGLVGMSSSLQGFAVHMSISALIGASYGILFRREPCNDGAAVGWGATYGLIWWFLGPLTLMPILLGSGVQWTAQAAQSAFPSFVGHLGYGVATALVYQWLSRRERVTGVMRRSQAAFNQPVPTAPAALWVFTLVTVTLLLMLL